LLTAAILPWVSDRLHRREAASPHRTWVLQGDGGHRSSDVGAADVAELQAVAVQLAQRVEQQVHA
jgi:hypothetical protein